MNSILEFQHLTYLDRRYMLLTNSKTAMSASATESKPALVPKKVLNKIKVTFSKPKS